MTSTGTTTSSRRAKVRAAQLNGVDAVEVGDDGLTLTVTFLGKAPHGLCAENVRIDGGRLHHRTHRHHSRRPERRA